MPSSSPDWVTIWEHRAYWFIGIVVVLLVMLALRKRMLAMFNQFIAVPVRDRYLDMAGGRDTTGKHRYVASAVA